MTYIADLTDMTLPIGDGRQDLWVGWVGDTIEQTGSTSARILTALTSARNENQLWDGTLGSHTCEICRHATGHGHFFVLANFGRYILPNLVIHYITEHQYKLPGVVEEALLPGSA
jgi:hypothetical protein